MKLLQRRNSFWTSNQKLSRANKHKHLDQLIKNIIPLTKISRLLLHIWKWRKILSTKIMDIINKQDKSPEIIWLIEKRQEKTEADNLRFKFDSNFNRKVWVPRRPNEGGRDEVVAIDLGLLFRSKERNRWGGGYFEFNEPIASTSTERNQQQTTQNGSNFEEGGAARPAASFPKLRSERLRYRLKDNSQFPGQPHDRKAKICKHRSGGQS